VSDEPPDDPAAARYRAALKAARDCLAIEGLDPSQWTCDESAVFLDTYDRWVFTFYDGAGNTAEVKIHDNPEDVDP
jgi:hypothetical protein